jgi:hypothetical protein
MNEPVTLLLFRSTPSRIGEEYVAAALPNFETFRLQAGDWTTA